MLFRYLYQEVAAMIMIAGIIIIFLVGIGIFVAWFSRSQGAWGVVPRFLGFIIGGPPIALALAGMLGTPGYSYSGTLFSSGFLLFIGATILGIGNEVANHKTKKAVVNLNGAFWISANTAAVIVSYYILDILRSNYLPALWLVVYIAQWILLRFVIRVSPLWILGTLFPTLVYYIDLNFYICAVLMACWQWFILQSQNPKGALWFSGISLVGWIYFYRMWEFLPNFYEIGVIIIWSSILVGIIAARFIRPRSNDANNESDRAS